MPSAIDFKNINRTTDFTDAVNRIDNLYDFTSQIATFTERNTEHKNITFDLTDKKIVVPNSSQRGARDFTKGREKDVTPVSIFLDYIKERDNISKDDFEDYRLPGSAGEMDTLTAVRMDKLTGLQNNVAQAIEYQRLSALTGVTTNAYGKTICDSYALTGTTQNSVDFLLGTAGTEVGVKINEAVRTSANNYRSGAIMPMPIAVVTDEFFDKLISHPTVKEAYANYSSTDEYLRNSQIDMQRFGSVQMFRYKNVLFVAYNPLFNILDANGYDTTTAQVMSGSEGYLLPANAPDLLRSYWGPSQRLDVEGGRRMFANEYMSEDGEEWNMTVESAGLHFCTNPLAITRIFSSN